MRVFHNTRQAAYRSPYGALELGKSVMLAVDVTEADVAEVLLRTWIDDEGEARYPMLPSPDSPGRYEVSYMPEAPGVVWYHFIVKVTDGSEKRYGARDGMRGGIGELRDWEPPSFQLTVYDAENSAAPVGEASLVEDVIDYLTGLASAPTLVETVEELRENVPPATFKNAIDGWAGLDHAHLYARLAAADPNPAKGRLWCASLIQALLVDGACVADGARDLSSSVRYDGDCEVIAENARDLRRILKVSTRACDLFAANDDVIGFWLRADAGATGGTPSAPIADSVADSAPTPASGSAPVVGFATDTFTPSFCVLINASLANAHDVEIPLPVGAEAVCEVISGYGVPLSDDGAVACPHLYQLGSAILYFHDEERLQRPMEPGVGVLAHVTSLPTKAPRSQAALQKPGTMGAPARAFVDWLAERDMRYWQVLPVNPTDEHGSPYAGISAFAGNTRLIEAGDAGDAGGAKAGDAGAGSLATRKMTAAEKRGFQAFCEREADWLEPYASFMAIRRKIGEGVTWQDWPDEYHRFDPGLIAADPELSGFAEQERRAQYAFDRQWRDLRAYANERGIQVIGDMPIYVSADSSDVWAHPDIFQLGADGRPLAVAGCPPDQFAVEGQVWGNPVYDWDALRESGYAWWLRRLERAFELYDVVRLDHFIGFARYFSIADGEKAITGTYRPGPGAELFERAREQFGPLPIIAEDLGLITPAVRALVAICGFPGMDIVQFVDGNDPLSGYRPRPEKVAYTGTHDNQTLVGYAHARYPHLDARETAATLMKEVLASDAPVRIAALQDILGLDDAARMNTPGTTEGNWMWQADPADLQS